MKNSIINSKKLYYLLGVLLIITIWQISSLIIKNELILPSFFQTIKSIFKLNDAYLAIFLTLKRLLISVILCFILALFLSVVSIFSYKIEGVIKPFISMCKTLPVIVVLLFIWFVFGKIYIPYLVTGLVILPIMYEGILNGFKSIDKSILEEVEMNSKTNFYIIYKIYIPLAISHIISSLLQSIGLGLKVMVMSEFIVLSKNTIGYKIYYYAFYEIETKMVFAWGIILVMLIMIVDSLLRLLNDKIAKLV